MAQEILSQVKAQWLSIAVVLFKRKWFFDF
jgi:hypothetical protein